MDGTNYVHDHYYILLLWLSYGVSNGNKVLLVYCTVTQVVRVTSFAVSLALNFSSKAEVLYVMTK